MNERFKKVSDRLSPELKQRVSKSFDISDQILDILEKKRITQKQLADKLGKSESEVSKWMKGDHNFTIDTIVKIEIALEEKIIDTPNNYQKARLASEDTKDQFEKWDKYKPASFKTSYLNNTIEIPVKTAIL